MSTEGLVKVQGWVTEVRRQSKKLLFIKVWKGPVPDGPNNILQIVVSGTKDELDSLPVTRYAVIEAIGEIVESIGTEQAIEMQSKPSCITVLGPVDQLAFPIKPQFQDDISLRHNALHLRERTQRYRAIARVRHLASMGIEQYFHSKGYTKIFPPLITCSDCEGAGETFEVVAPGVPDFFGGTDQEPLKAYLTVSAQLHGEAAATALGPVYTFAPSFRAEKSQTNRHLSQFMHVEPEVPFMDLNGLVLMATEFLQSVIRYVLQPEGRSSIEYLAAQTDRPLIKELTYTCNNVPTVITYTKAVELLQEVHNTSYKFEEEPRWGGDLSSEQEKYLCEKIFTGITVVTHYPRAIKARYMYVTNIEAPSDQQTVSCMDILVPGIGEVFGGSQRETRMEILEPEMMRLGPQGQYNWYLDLRRFGNVPHSGFGMGFERLLCYLTGVPSVRDVTQFPVAYRFLKV